MINSQIFITSLNKEIEKSKKYGKLDLSVIYFFNIVRYYINYTEGVEILNEVNKQLKDLAYYLKYKYPNILCNYKIIDNTLGVVSNNPPTIDDKTIDLNGYGLYIFLINDFLTNYQDAENHTYKKVRIDPTNLTSGSLVLNGEIITQTVETNLDSTFNLLYYTEEFNLGLPNANVEVNDIVNFKVSDILDAYSTTQKITIINSKYIANQPPIIGDINITVDNNVTTILNLAMFTTLMNPPYNDPENDLIDAIRIDSISSSNQGQFLYDNIPVQVGDIINREDIELELFKHVGPNITSVTTDSLSFSARDEGSLIWVQ